MLTLRRVGQAAPGRQIAIDSCYRAVATQVCFLITVLCFACSSSSNEPTEQSESGLPSVTLTNRQGQQAVLQVEIADTPPERERGLSMRESLAANAGMLFVIEERGPGFWMKDTLIPLSVAFIDRCGQIVHIAHMEPLSLQIHGTDRDYRFGLEVNRGWFEQNRIAVGDRVILPPAYRPAGCA